MACNLLFGMTYEDASLLYLCPMDGALNKTQYDFPTAGSN